VTSSPGEARFRDVLPSCYRHLLPALFDRPYPREPYAPCDRCTMLPPPGVDPGSRRFFRPDTKCCTYQPFLPNYAVGGLLCAEETRGSLGRERIRERLAQRLGVVPTGIRPSARYMVGYRDKFEFGNTLALRCPYYDEPHGGCSVWPFREANCTTWFCKVRHGRDGLNFWTSLRTYLHALERVLARYSLRRLGFPAELVLRAAELPDTAEAAVLEESPDGEAARQALWGDWLGREDELYEACYRSVLDLQPAPLVEASELALLPGELAKEQDHVEQALARMLEPTLPPLLRRNPAIAAERVPEGWLVTSYSPFDAIQLSEAVWDALVFFDGVTDTATARERIGAKRGQRLSEALLVRLVQLEILVPA
jgi:hypothetical protein